MSASSQEERLIEAIYALCSKEIDKAPYPGSDFDEGRRAMANEIIETFQQDKP